MINMNSKRFLVLMSVAIIVTLLFLVVGQAASVYNDFTRDEIEDILYDLQRVVGYELQEVEQEEGYARWWIKLREEDGDSGHIFDYNLFAYDDDKGNETEYESLMINYALDMDFGPSLKEINRWNAESRFSRAYLDDEEDPNVEIALNLGGGVTRDAVVNFFRLGHSVISDFYDFV